LHKIFSMELIFITIFFLGFAILGISIKIWGKKNGEFSGTCASQNPMLNKNNEPCGFCGKPPRRI
jgi:hypothetical protein